MNEIGGIQPIPPRDTNQDPGQRRPRTAFPDLGSPSTDRRSEGEQKPDHAKTKADAQPSTTKTAAAENRTPAASDKPVSQPPTAIPGEVGEGYKGIDLWV